MADRVLEGIRIVNTRAEHQAPELTKMLTDLGAEVLHYPTIRIESPPDSAELDDSLKAAIDGQFQWLLLTSSNTVEMIRRRLESMGRKASELGDGLQVAAIGRATAAAAKERLGFDVNFIPEDSISESLAEGLPVKDADDILLPQSARARPLLAERLRRNGANVTTVVAYHTLIGEGGDFLPEHFWQGNIDVVTFTSASTVNYFVHRLKEEEGSRGMLVDVCVACIGPVTAAAARRHELPVRVVASEHSLPALVRALSEYFQRAPAGR